ncbi:HugZ family heme oxygenase [Campylobacter fetus]|uniref:HugZ family heme oxygenase n=1 Tax=Campylobacter fetus TaxID=196 RepID=UPI0003C26097|nr:HugZ family heme oxygenase [Campylobacter fetus]AGZ82537.1 iron-responsive cellular heme oxygenase [Campylobacter fetus subsp. testudinum 03-427]AJB46251.1 pyridoxamine 5'-phosphate oxidase [Campylobacter fetus subsp. testudinum]AVK81941.1 HugZ family heme oxygenase [Campylobacter fetus subsp. testudinum]EAI4322437.1 HugZ family heme oxygenase [Campylobacter fetus]EAI4391249.1 HugZ family heme oxygenase [Campylobacter fetus]
MDAKQKVIEHINNDHMDTLIMLCKHFGTVQNPTNVRLDSIDEDGMDIACDQLLVRVAFLKKAEQSGKGFRTAIIDLMSSLDIKESTATVSKDMVDFIDGFNSVLISSLNGDHCVCSYAPVVRDDNDFYILISEVSEHFKSIKENSDKISIMFLEDESKAKTIFARKRASFRSKAVFLDDQKESLFSKFESKFSSESAIKMIKNMSDFHIIKIEITKGRFVKGFGAAYDTNGLEIIQRVHSANPHNTK